MSLRDWLWHRSAKWWPELRCQKGLPKPFCSWGHHLFCYWHALVPNQVHIGVRIGVQTFVRLHACDYVCQQIEGTPLDQRVWFSEHTKYADEHVEIHVLACFLNHLPSKLPRTLMLWTFLREWPQCLMVSAHSSAIDGG